MRITLNKDFYKGTDGSSLSDIRCNQIVLLHNMLKDIEEEYLTYKDILEEDVYLLRMWIVQDPKNDDAKKDFMNGKPLRSYMFNIDLHSLLNNFTLIFMFPKFISYIYKIMIELMVYLIHSLIGIRIIKRTSIFYIWTYFYIIKIFSIFQ